MYEESLCTSYYINIADKQTYVKSCLLWSFDPKKRSSILTNPIYMYIFQFLSKVGLSIEWALFKTLN